MTPSKCPQCERDISNNEPRCSFCGWVDRDAPCKICLDTDFEWGQLHGHHRVVFVPMRGDRPLLKMLSTGKLVTTRACLGCGHLENFLAKEDWTEP